MTGSGTCVQCDSHFRSTMGNRLLEMSLCVPDRWLVLHKEFELQSEEWP